jgi:membrane protein DedA with SNARE-associated domain
VTLMSDKTLPVVVAALAGSLAGVLLGLWLGARSEQRTLVDLITRADLTPQCRAELDRGIKSTLEDWEGPGAAPAN